MSEHLLLVTSIIAAKSESQIRTDDLEYGHDSPFPAPNSASGNGHASGLKALTAAASSLAQALESHRRAKTQTGMGHLWHPPRIHVGFESRVCLTSREGEVLLCLAANLRDKEIASLLSIEVSTVKTHVHNLLKKSALRSRRALAAIVLKELV